VGAAGGRDLGLVEFEGGDVAVVGGEAGGEDGGEVVVEDAAAVAVEPARAAARPRVR
jgi:hypothetical protein